MWARSQIARRSASFGLGCAATYSGDQVTSGDTLPCPKAMLSIHVADVRNSRNAAAPSGHRAPAAMPTRSASRSAPPRPSAVGNGATVQSSSRSSTRRRTSQSPSRTRATSPAKKGSGDSFPKGKEPILQADDPLIGLLVLDPLWRESAARVEPCTAEEDRPCLRPPTGIGRGEGDRFPPRHALDRCVKGRERSRNASLKGCAASGSPIHVERDEVRHNGDRIPLALPDSEPSDVLAQERIDTVNSQPFDRAECARRGQPCDFADLEPDQIRSATRSFGLEEPVNISARGPISGRHEVDLNVALARVEGPDDDGHRLELAPTPLLPVVDLGAHAPGL
jgi:hypothetical protein